MEDPGGGGGGHYRKGCNTQLHLVWPSYFDNPRAILLPKRLISMAILLWLIIWLWFIVWSNMGLILVIPKDIFLHAVSQQSPLLTLGVETKKLENKKKMLLELVFHFCLTYRTWNNTSLYKQPASLGEICMQCLKSNWVKTQLCQKN
jgi:hypothetical protein